MPVLCKSRAAARVLVRVRVRSYKKSASFIESERKSELSNEINMHLPDYEINMHLPDCEHGNRVMVVVDSNPEAKGALEWALSHTVQNQDTIVLLHVARKGTCTPYIFATNLTLIRDIMFDVPDGKPQGEIDQRAYNLLQVTKNVCQLTRPEVHVEITTRKGREKGAIIVEVAKQLKVSLLVLGHQKQSFLCRLRKIGMSKRNNSSIVDYCIQNANCMTLSVRRKNRKYGGYLITTKRHKNFWLLA
ncbi:hypothetical protein DH2020_043111 [Rehmannia glutinosa]|uniref:UspA domain-containing protein n=1 Tax=Rehmannia glutinosa TaxID=99300 RepID=A0ABR0UKM3_REHGL